MSGTPSSKASMATQTPSPQSRQQQSNVGGGTSSAGGSGGGGGGSSRPSGTPSCCENILGSDNSFFSLKWNEFDKQLSSGFSSLFYTQDLADVTLSCEGKSARAHKIVLAMCSPYFRYIFKENPCKHPVVIIKGIMFRDLEHILKFIYFGHVSVVKSEIQDFIDAAELLKLDGISSDTSSEPPRPHHSESDRSLAGLEHSRTPPPAPCFPSSTGSVEETRDPTKRITIKQELSPTEATSKNLPIEMAVLTPGMTSMGLGTRTSNNSCRNYESISPLPFPPSTHFPPSTSSQAVSRPSKHQFRGSPPSESSLHYHHTPSAINHGRKINYGVPWTSVSPKPPTTLPLHVGVPSLSTLAKPPAGGTEEESLDLSSPTASIRSKASPADPLHGFLHRSMTIESNAAASVSMSSAVVRSRSSSCDNSTDSHASHTPLPHTLLPHHPLLINLEETTEESRDSLVTETNAGEYELSIQTVESPYGRLKSFTTPSGMVVTSTLHPHGGLPHPSTSTQGQSGWVVGMGLKPSTATSTSSSGQSGTKSGYRSLLHFPNGPLIPKLSAGMGGGVETPGGSHVSQIPAKKRFSHLSHRVPSLYGDVALSTDKNPLERARHLAKLSGVTQSKTESATAGSSSTAGALGVMVGGTGGGVLGGVPRLTNQRHSQVPKSARYTTAEVDAMVDSVTNHSGPFVPCKICDKLVKRERLRAHIHECHLVHGEKIICPHCGVGLKSKGSYRVHVWRHRRGVLTKGLKSAKRVMGQRRDPPASPPPPPSTQPTTHQLT